MEIFEVYNVTVFAVIMERPDFIPYEEEDILPIQYRLLMQRFNFFGMENKNDMLVIFDKVDDKKDGFIAKDSKVLTPTQ